VARAAEARRRDGKPAAAAARPPRPPPAERTGGDPASGGSSGRGGATAANRGLGSGGECDRRGRLVQRRGRRLGRRPWQQREEWLQLCSGWRASRVPRTCLAPARGRAGRVQVSVSSPKPLPSLRRQAWRLWYSCLPSRRPAEGSSHGCQCAFVRAARRDRGRGVRERNQRPRPLRRRRALDGGNARNRWDHRDGWTKRDPGGRPASQRRTVGSVASARRSDGRRRSDATSGTQAGGAAEASPAAGGKAAVVPPRPAGKPREEPPRTQPCGAELRERRYGHGRRPA